MSLAGNAAFTASRVIRIEDLISRYTALLGERPVIDAQPSCVTDLMEDIHKLTLDMWVSLDFSCRILTGGDSMGECSFGRGVGETNSECHIKQDGTDDIWRSIPPSIFRG